jgi:hypothetical protein
MPWYVPSSFIWIEALFTLPMDRQSPASAFRSSIPDPANATLAKTDRSTTAAALNFNMLHLHDLGLDVGQDRYWRGI